MIVNSIQKPNEFASESEKNSLDWSKQMTDWVISICIANKEQEKILKFLDAANNITDNSTFKYVMETFNSVGGTPADLPGKIRNIDFITPIKEKYMGEFMNTYDNFQVYNRDINAVKRKNKELAVQLDSLLEQSFINILNEQGLETEQPNEEVPDFNEYYEKASKEWHDKVTIDSKHLLNFVNDIINHEQKYLQLFYYWLNAGYAVSYRDIRDGGFHYEVIHPLDYFRAPSDEQFIEDDPYGTRKFTISIESLYTKFATKFDKETLSKLEEFIKEYRRTRDWSSSINSILMTRVDDRTSPTDRGPFKRLSTNEAAYSTSGFDVGFLTGYHTVYKTPVRGKKLIYLDIYGALQEKVVNEDYDIRPEYGDIELVDFTFYEVRESYRFGEPGWALYTISEVIDVAREDSNNVNVCKLPYNGITSLAFGDQYKPIPYRVLEYQELYKLYTLIEERIISKFKSILMIPESLVADSKYFKMEERMDAANRDGYLFFNDAEARELQGVLQNIREVANTASINFLEVVNSIKMGLKQEAYELANMNDQRAGNIDGRDGKGTTELALNQKLIGTIWMTGTFDLFRERDYIANIDWAKTAYLNGISGAYFEASRGEMQYFDINGYDLMSYNIGVFVGNSSKLNRQLQELKELAFSAGQNGRYDIQAQAITNDDIPSLLDYINKAAELDRQIEITVQQQAQQAEQELQQLKNNIEERRLQHEAEQNKLDRDSQEYIELIKASTTLANTDKKLEVDLNGNGYIDKNEEAVARGEIGNKLNDTLTRLSLGLQQIKAKNKNNK